MDKLYLGRLYKNIGLDTQPAIVEKRIETATPILEKLNFQQAESLVILLMSKDIDISAIQWLVDACQDNEPGFGASGVDQDVELFAAFLLKSAIEAPKTYGRMLCVAIEAANFGGHRVCKVDSKLPEVAREKLLGFQTESVPLTNMEAVDFIDYSEEFAFVDGHAPSNQLAASWPKIKSILEGTISSTENFASSTSDKITELTAYLKRIEEQVQTQWFAIAKWSLSAKSPFIKLNVGEAATRAAYELAGMVKTSIGPAAAPALLNMALSEALAHSQNKELTFVNACTSAPLSWRRAELKLETRTERIKLTPTLAAIAMANEANDEADWPVRFKRELGIDPQFNVSPFDFSVQLFHELLVLRAKV